MKSPTPELMKFKRLQRLLGETRRGTIGLLEGMWIAVAKNCPAGDIGRFSNEEIAILCDWDGDADELIRALVDCRWLDACQTHRLVVHDWAEHCPKYIKGNMSTHKKMFATATPLEQASKQPAIATHSEDATTKPSLTKPNLTKPSQAIDSSVVENPTTEPTPVVRPPEIVLTYPTNGDPNEWHLDREQLSEWQMCYPDFDVLAECRKALAWVNAGGYKTARGMRRFLVRWLNRVNDSGGSRRGLPGRSPPQTDREAIKQKRREELAKWASEEDLQ